MKSIIEELELKINKLKTYIEEQDVIINRYEEEIKSQKKNICDLKEMMQNILILF